MLASAFGAQTATDDFAEPHELTGNEPSDRGDNIGASMETGEPNVVDGATVGNSVWVSWTAPGPGTATVDTCYSDFDTALAAYEGPSVSELTLVSGNDDAVPPYPIAEPGSDPRASRIVFPVEGGVTYHLAIAGVEIAGEPGMFEAGDFRLRLDHDPPPGNDGFTAAAPLSGDSTGASALSVGASKEAGEPDHAGNEGGASIWWEWKAPAGGTATIDTCESNFDTLLAVYTGAEVGSLSGVAANNDEAECAAPLASRVSFAATVGTTYWIAVDGANVGSGPQVGHVQLRLQSPSGAPTEQPPLLPDLVPVRVDEETVKTYYDKEEEGRKWINIGFKVRNVGAGPLEVFPEIESVPNDCNGDEEPEDDRIALQNYYLDANGNGEFERDVDTEVKTRAAGCNEFHPTHRHWHSAVVESELLREPSGAVARSLDKVTFCLTDWTRIEGPALPGRPGGAYYPLGNCDQVSLQGISVGWADQYSAGYSSQDLDITGLESGHYCIRTSLDLTGNILEASKENNVAERQIVLDMSQTPPGLTLLEEPCEFEAPPPEEEPAEESPPPGGEPAPPLANTAPSVSSVPPQVVLPSPSVAPKTAILGLSARRRGRLVAVRFRAREPGGAGKPFRFRCKLDRHRKSGHR